MIEKQSIASRSRARRERLFFVQFDDITFEVVIEVFVILSYSVVYDLIHYLEGLQGQIFFSGCHISLFRDSLIFANIVL